MKKKMILDIAQVIGAVAVVLFIFATVGVMAYYSLHLIFTKMWLAEEHVTGVYNSSVKILLCEAEYACLHEVGHWLDDELERPSSSDDFKMAVKTLVDWCAKSELNGEYWYCWIKDEKRGYREMYAEIYEFWRITGIKPPYGLAKFYQNEQ